MKTTLRTGQVIAILLGMGWIVSTGWADPAAAEYRFSLDQKSRLWLEGDSTLHAYESEAREIRMNSMVVSAPEEEAAAIEALLRNGPEIAKVESLELTIPVKEMKSGVPGLASQMHRALKEKTCPNIVFRMKEYSISRDADGTNRYAVILNGELTLAGETKPVEVHATATAHESELEITGERDLRMTDFGVTPPTMMLGAIKTDDKVVIKWNLFVKVEKTKDGSSQEGLATHSASIHVAENTGRNIPPVSTEKENEL